MLLKEIEIDMDQAQAELDYILAPSDKSGGEDDRQLEDMVISTTEVA
jgi:hypothetical protein